LQRCGLTAGLQGSSCYWILLLFYFLKLHFPRSGINSILHRLTAYVSII